MCMVLRILTYVFDQLYFPECLTSFSSADHLLFYSFSSNTDEVLPFNPSAIVFVFGDFNIHHKVRLIYSVGIDRPGELCYSFPNSNDLTQRVNFPSQIPGCDSQSPALFD